MGDTKTLNLTPFFLFWTAVWATFAVVTNHMGLLWVAAIPWIIWLGLVLVIFLVGCAAVLVIYLGGHPVTVTSRKGVRVVQRGRQTVWKVRR